MRTVTDDGLYYGPKPTYPFLSLNPIVFDESPRSGLAVNILILRATHTPSWGQSTDHCQTLGEDKENYRSPFADYGGAESKTSGHLCVL